jgi:deoxycytidine triphosphate deaminase
MKLLTDTDLHQWMIHTSPIIKGVPKPPGGNWFAPDSAVQPCSIDLHIGEIFLPETKKDEPGHQDSPIRKHILEAGHTAVVTTRESFSLPPDIAGIGFPPDSVSSQGILMTNPGHVDPGYKGSLRFTLINMGSGDYELREGDSIVTMLLFELSSPVQKDYASRRAGQSKHGGIQDTLNHLAADFVNVEKRAAKIATMEVGKAALWAAVMPAFVSGIIALITALAVSWFSPSWKEPIQDMKKDLALLQGKADANDLRSDIRSLQSKADPNELKNKIFEMQQQMAELRLQITKPTPSPSEQDIPRRRR